MLKRLAVGAALAVLALASTGLEAQTPRKGGTLRMTAPYGASLSSLDIHTTPRAQDGIVAKLIHRSLYKWDTAANKPVLELATEVKTTNGGLTHT
ncbi:MAG: ABC transporter substrate-binding protein, partial [Hyphomicrobiaceae bacterium]